jgi:hypothetical protein
MTVLPGILKYTIEIVLDLPGLWLWNVSIGLTEKFVVVVLTTL